MIDLLRTNVLTTSVLLSSKQTSKDRMMKKSRQARESLLTRPQLRESKKEGRKGIYIYDVDCG